MFDPAFLHILRNKIATITSCTEWALSNVDGDSPVRQSLEDALEVCRVVSKLVQPSEVDAPNDASPVDISNAFLECVPRLRAVLPSSVSLELGPIPSLPPVASSSLRVSRVLLDIADRIADRTDAGVASVRIALGHDGPSAPQRGDAPHGHGVRNPGAVQLDVAIRTFRGGGVPRGPVGALFTSLRDLASELGGVATLETQQDTGAQLVIRLPVGSPENDRMPARRGAVLIVDDDELFSMSQERVLADEGLSSVRASTGSEALDRLLKNPDSIWVVLLDLHLIGAGGDEVLGEIRALRPELPVIVATGYATPSIVERVSMDERLFLLRKPYETDQLLQLLRSLL